MEAKIPLISLKDPPSTDPSLKSIKCPLCEGILYDPVYCTKKRMNYCKQCYITQKGKILSLTYDNLYNPSVKEAKKNLNLYKYICPNFDYQENQKEKEYTYDELINHLIVCENNKIICPECGEETFLKSLENNSRKNLEKVILWNKILERELEYQKSRIIQMEEEKKETKEIAEKQEKKEEKEEKEEKKVEEKKPDPPKPKVEKQKIQIVIKKPPRKSAEIKPKNIMKFKKGELPPIKRKSRVYEKKDMSPPKVNLEKKNNFKKPKPKEPFLDNSKNTTLFDKCPHFYGNYLPKFACCNKFYGCYLCHNEKEDHIYRFSNKVACLFCKTVYAGKNCPKCRANQLFQRKML
jgi:hypothetical protein